MCRFSPEGNTEPIALLRQMHPYPVRHAYVNTTMQGVTQPIGVPVELSNGSEMSCLLGYYEVHRVMSIYLLLGKWINLLDDQEQRRYTAKLQRIIQSQYLVLACRQHTVVMPCLVKLYQRMGGQLGAAARKMSVLIWPVSATKPSMNGRLAHRPTEAQSVIYCCRRVNTGVNGQPEQLLHVSNITADGFISAESLVHLIQTLKGTLCVSIRCRGV